METVLEILAKVKPNVDFKNATAIVDDGLLRLVALFSFQIRIGAVLLKSTVCLAAIFCQQNKSKKARVKNPNTSWYRWWG